jgi:hypothetical protein
LARFSFVAFAGLFLALPCAAQQPPVPAHVSATWEIKGIRLGASKDDVLAAVPGVVCKVEAFDAGLESCRDENAMLADKRALLRVKLLDGKVVLVELANLGRKQLEAATDALAAKFGPPTDIDESTYKPSFGDHVVRGPRHRWIDGDVQLVMNALEPRSDGGFPEGAVYLFDVDAHDKEWLGRYRAKGKGREAAEAIGL